MAAPNMRESINAEEELTSPVASVTIDRCDEANIGSCRGCTRDAVLSAARQSCNDGVEGEHANWEHT